MHNTYALLTLTDVTANTLHAFTELSKTAFDDFLDLLDGEAHLESVDDHRHLHVAIQFGVSDHVTQLQLAEARLFGLDK